MMIYFHIIQIICIFHSNNCFRAFIILYNMICYLTCDLTWSHEIETTPCEMRHDNPSNKTRRLIHVTTIISKRMISIELLRYKMSAKNYVLDVGEAGTYDTGT